MSNEIAYVNVSSANVYREATFHSEIDTQTVLWEKVFILGTEKDFVRIESEDLYQGWVNRHQLAYPKTPAQPARNKVTSPLITLHIEPDEKSQVVRDGCAGCSLPVLSERNGWNEIALPDGNKAWVNSAGFTPLGELTRGRLINYAKQFLGVPYFWGGKTAKGFDCSGFMQFLHGMFELKLRRDAWMQFEDAQSVSDDPLAGAPGDLMFFAENGDRITHVGMCLGTGQLLHARGMVRINSLKKSEKLFDQSLLRDFVGIKTFLR